jgi:hypothetical protein
VTAGADKSAMHTSEEESNCCKDVEEVRRLNLSSSKYAGFLRPSPATLNLPPPNVLFPRSKPNPQVLRVEDVEEDLKRRSSKKP